MNDHPNVLELELPEIQDRDPYTCPTSHLEKTGPDAWTEVPGRRDGKTLLVNQIRQAVDAWHEADYPDISDTSRRLLQYWFDEDHMLPSGAVFR